MTVPQVCELMAYWREQPPVHELIAAWVGWKRKPAETIMECTKISPTLGDLPAAAPRPKVPANDMGNLVALASRRGGKVRLEDLIGR